MTSLRVLINKRRMSLPACSLVIFAMWVSATPAQSPKGQDDTVKLKAHLITMDVMVKDKNRHKPPNLETPRESASSRCPTRRTLAATRRVPRDRNGR